MTGFDTEDGVTRMTVLATPATLPLTLTLSVNVSTPSADGEYWNTRPEPVVVLPVPLLKTDQE